MQLCNSGLAMSVPGYTLFSDLPRKHTRAFRPWIQCQKSPACKSWARRDTRELLHNSGYIDNHMAVQRQAAPNRANFNPVSTMADKQVLLKARPSVMLLNSAKPEGQASDTLMREQKHAAMHESDPW